MSSSATTGEAESTTTDFRCVQCGFPVKALYIQYSPGNIRLVKCGSCKAVADGYIECEIMILILDLILNKPKAYRHVFYNKETVKFESLLWKSAVVYGVLDIYKMWVLSTNEKEYPMPASSFMLEFGKMLTGVVFGIFVFLSVLFYGTRKLLSAATGAFGWKQILFVAIVSSYFKIFLLAMMVWEFPSSVTIIIDILVLSSNTVALKVITNSTMMRCLAVCALAHGMKCLASQNKAFVFQRKYDLRVQVLPIYESVTQYFLRVIHYFDPHLRRRLQFCIEENKQVPCLVNKCYKVMSLSLSRAFIYLQF